jgi:para-nitrobenzyl esterase
LCKDISMIDLRVVLGRAALVAIVACFMTPPAAAADQPTIALTAGTIAGVAVDGGATFKGIPFAQPPVGALRWRDPQPVKPWSGVLQTVAFGKSCAIEGSEDCLYLNVWVPQWPARARLPVMVWFPSGGNFTGATSEAKYQSSSIPQHGVILVSAAFRLSIFGFLAHPALSAESPHHTSGNYGLLDMIAAMHWVRDNIARFGGDPGNVTLWGESSTSLDLNVLLTSPLERGLFKRQITESGPVINLPTLAEGERKGVETMAKASIADAPDALAKMRALSTAEIWKLNGTALAWVGPSLGVLVDGYVFPQSPFVVFQSGKENPVPLLMGNNARELQKPFFPMPNGLTGAIEEIYGPLAPEARALYAVGAATEPPPDPRLGPMLAQFATDTQFRCGTVAELRWHTQAGNRSFEFEFDRVPPGKEANGAVHASELPYVFGTFASLGGLSNDIDTHVSATMEQYWTNFAKTGNPNGPGLPQWPAFDPQGRAYIEFTDNGPIVRANLRAAACDLYGRALEHPAQP